MSTNTNNTTKGNKMNITIDSVSEGLVVTGTCNGNTFSSSPFRWGAKMLMKVTSTHEFTQGEKVAIGHASKKALKTANMALPEAVLVRPRKPKVQVEAVTESQPEVTEA